MPLPNYEPMRLSAAAIQSFEPGPTPYRVYDSIVQGLHVLVLPSGTATWNIHFRLQGRLRRLSLGRARGDQAIEPKDARVRARAVLGDVAYGEDPGKARERDRLAKDFATVARAYMEDLESGEITVGRKRGGGRGEKRRAAETTIKSRRTCIRHAIAKLGTRRLSDIDGRLLDRAHNELGRTVGKTTANRVMTTVSLVFKYAADLELVDRGHDPTRDVTPFEERARHAPLLPEDYRRLGASLTAYEAKHPRAVPGIEALRFLALTGRRRDEARLLRWEDVDLEGATMRCETKTGRKTFVLPRAAVDVLRRQRKRVPEDAPWTFPSPTGEGAFGNLNTLWTAVCADAEIAETRIHDLRHSVAVVLTRMGYPDVVVASVLGHAVAKQSVTWRYAAPTDDVTRAAADAAADEIAASVAGVAP